MFVLFLENRLLLALDISLEICFCRKSQVLPTKIFLVTYWPWKWTQAHRNLNYSSHTLYKFDLNPFITSGVNTSYFWLKFDKLWHILWPWKWGQDHHNLTNFKACPHHVSLQVWWESANLLKYYGADKKLSCWHSYQCQDASNVYSQLMSSWENNGHFLVGKSAFKNRLENKDSPWQMQQGTIPLYLLFHQTTSLCQTCQIHWWDLLLWIPTLLDP